MSGCITVQKVGTIGFQSLETLVPLVVCHLFTFLVGKGKSDLDVPYLRTFALDAEGSTVAYSYDSNIDPLSLINNHGGEAIGSAQLNTTMPSFVLANP